MRYRAVALAAVLLLPIVGGCTNRTPPRVVISYSTTPMPAEFVLPTPSPTPTRSHRPTRIPTPSPSEVDSPVGTATVLPDSGTAERTVDSTATSAETPAPKTNGNTAHSTPSPGPSAVPTSIPGQVPEAQGAFVTSSSRGSRYYYARDDTGWHRIQPENRVWFLTVDALLRAFPDRIPHDAPTATPSHPRTPTAAG